MKIGFVIFVGMTALGLVGVYDAVTRLEPMGLVPDLQWRSALEAITWMDTASICTDHGRRIARERERLI